MSCCSKKSAKFKETVFEQLWSSRPYRTSIAAGPLTPRPLGQPTINMDQPSLRDSCNPVTWLQQSIPSRDFQDPTTWLPRSRHVTSKIPPCDFQDEMNGVEWLESKYEHLTVHTIPYTVTRLWPTYIDLTTKPNLSFWNMAKMTERSLADSKAWSIKQTINQSGLDYILSESPFSISVKIRKRFLLDRSQEISPLKPSTFPFSSLTTHKESKFEGMEQEINPT